VRRAVCVRGGLYVRRAVCVRRGVSVRRVVCVREGVCMRGGLCVRRGVPQGYMVSIVCLLCQERVVLGNSFEPLFVKEIDFFFCQR